MSLFLWPLFSFFWQASSEGLRRSWDRILVNVVVQDWDGQLQKATFFPVIDEFSLLNIEGGERLLMKPTLHIIISAYFNKTQGVRIVVGGLENPSRVETNIGDSGVAGFQPFASDGGRYVSLYNAAVCVSLRS